MKRTLTLTEKEQKLLLAGLRAAIEWELSYADAHNLAIGGKIEPVYSETMKLVNKYKKLRAKCFQQLEEQGRKIQWKPVQLSTTKLAPLDFSTTKGTSWELT